MTSRQVPESLKTPDQPVRVEPQYEARVPVAGLKGLFSCCLKDCLVLEFFGFSSLDY